MPRFKDLNAPAGRVVFGGEVFVDGFTADIDPGPETLLLFKGAGITEVSVADDVQSWEAFVSGKPTKDALAAAAAALGLDTGGTKAEIQARIEEARAAGLDDIQE